MGSLNEWGVTDANMKILRIIYDYMVANSNRPPTIRDLVRLSGVKSHSTAHHHLEALAGAALITSGGGARMTDITPLGYAALGEKAVMIAAMPATAARYVVRVSGAPCVIEIDCEDLAVQMMITRALTDGGLYVRRVARGEAIHSVSKSA